MRNNHNGVDLTAAVSKATAIEDVTLPKVKDIIDTMNKHSGVDGKNLEWAEDRNINKLARALNHVLTLHENGATGKAVEGFAKIQRARHTIMSDPKEKTGQSALGYFAKNMIIQGSDGAPESSLEATAEIVKFTLQNPDASPQEFAKKLQECKAISLGAPEKIGRELPEVKETDRAGYIYGADKHIIRSDALPKKEQRDPNRAQEITPVTNILSAAVKREVNSRPACFEQVGSGRETFNTVGKDPLKVSEETIAQSNRVIEEAHNRQIEAGEEIVELRLEGEDEPVKVNWGAPTTNDGQNLG